MPEPGALPTGIRPGALRDPLRESIESSLATHDRTGLTIADTAHRPAVGLDACGKEPFHLLDEPAIEHGHAPAPNAILQHSRGPLKINRPERHFLSSESVSSSDCTCSISSELRDLERPHDPHQVLRRRGRRGFGIDP